MLFDVLGPITEIETIAVGSAIRDIARLREQYGPGRWRKLKGKATVRLLDGTLRKQKFIGTKLTGLVENGSR